MAFANSIAACLLLFSDNPIDVTANTPLVMGDVGHLSDNRECQFGRYPRRRPVRGEVIRVFYRTHFWRRCSVSDNVSVVCPGISGWRNDSIATELCALALYDERHVFAHFLLCSVVS